MTSEEAAQAFVWVHLPGQADPVVCGRFTQRRTAGGGAVGEFVYGQSYLARSQALAIDPVVLPLQAQACATPHLSGWFPVLLDAGPDTWGRRLIDRLHGPQDTLGYLLHACGQTVGALGFSAAADISPEAAQVPAMASLERLLDLHRAIEAGEPVAPEDHDLLLQGTSAGGARPKTTVEHEGAHVPGAGLRPGRRRGHTGKPAVGAAGFGYEVGEAAAMVREQWDAIRGTVVEQLLRHGCTERLAAPVVAAMPGQTFFRS